MSRARAAVAGGLACAAVLLATACGSSSDTGTTDTGGAQQATASPPAAASSATAAATATTPPAADRCNGKTFGPVLQPKDKPSDVHVYTAAPATQIDATKVYEATIKTPRGTIILCLDPALAPATVNNFVVLARNHFYDNLTFHRVVPDFVIQGGDPKGDGTGGPGYQFNDEPVKVPYAVGSLAMANSGPDTNGSQFFICIGSQCTTLPPQYNLFGEVLSGQDVANAVQQGDVMSTVTVAQSTS